LIGALSTSASGNPGDADVVEQLRRSGSDLDKPHHIEFFLYFPSESTARQAAATLTRTGFTAKVTLGADSANWLCLATKSMVPRVEALREIRANFSALATELGGEYDGWGTPVVK
jgi:hypothetical protein